MKKIIALLGPGLLGACATVTPPPPAPPPPVEVQLIGLNDFHGNIEPPEAVDIDGVKRELGGAAFLAGKVQALRKPGLPSITVAAGDLIGASPLTSAYFLDEPTIMALNMVGLDLAAVGNHEFDKGSAELLRMQSGGCEKHGTREPCAVDRPFAGASFRYLAANVIKKDGTTLLPATAIRRLGPITIGFVGMTLKETASLVTPAGVAGLTFADEVATANAAAGALKAAGADLLVLLIHQGGRTKPTYNVAGCPGLEGRIVPIIDALDPSFGVVLSGHTHYAYACQRPTADGRPRLLTSAGKNGYFVSDIRLTFDPARRLVNASARNEPVTREAGDPAVAALVGRYSAAAAPVADKVVGTLTATAPRSETDSESPAANLIADSLLAATSAREKGGGQIALVNGTGVRVGIPGGPVRYRDAFSMMPFGNNLVVMTLTGAQLKAVIEQQYDGVGAGGTKTPADMVPSEGLRFRVDLARPAGDRVVGLALRGRPVSPGAPYRVVVNNYLASGGDGLSGFTAGTEIVDPGIIDIDALIAWIAPGRSPPAVGRIVHRLGS